MKNIYKIIMVCFSAILLTGCGTNNISEKLQDVLEQAKPDAANADYDIAVEAYNRFLSNEEELYIEADNYELKAGAYKLAELKSKLAELNELDFCPKYKILDVTEDGDTAPILILRIESADTSYMNSVYFITYDDGRLKNTYYYSDGYRTYSYIWDNGYLEVGGSSGAGLFGYEFLKIKKDGTCGRIFDSNTASSMWVNNVEYDLGIEYDKISDYRELELFELQIDDLVCDDKVYFTVRSYSSDPTIKKSEDLFVEKLQGLGAELVEASAFDKMISEKREGNDMTSSENLVQDYEVVRCNALYPVALSGGTFVTADFVSYNGTDAFSPYPSFADDESITELTALTFNELVTDVAYVKLSMGNDAKKVDYDVAWTDECIGSKECIYLGVKYEGDTPTRGIMFTDGLGNSHLLTLEISGMDGSIVMNEVEMTR